MSFSWLTFGQAKAELATRLSDPGSAFWGDAEKGLYLAWAMRQFSCLSQFWIADYVVNLTSPLGANWIRSDGAGSPRQRILSDTDIYTMAQYMLLEPATGGMWSGTNQFNIADLAQALRGRRDEALQVGASNVVEITLPITPGTSRVTLPDTVLDVRRVRYVPAVNQGSPVVLQRGDGESFRTFTPAYGQTTQPPMRWDVITGTPLALTIDTLSPVPATLEVLVMQAEPIPAPPASTPLGVPDDWGWLVLFGTLADVLAGQEEAKDEYRSEYARTRFLEGMEMLMKAPWLLEANIAGIPVSTPSVTAADRFSYGWQDNQGAFPQIVVAGMDLYALSPSLAQNAQTSVKLTVVANTPIPVKDADFIQVPRDVMDALLDEAEHLALFKCGGNEFVQSLSLHKAFLGTVERWDARTRVEGIFPTTLRSQVSRGDVQQPRFAAPGKES